MGRPWYWPIGGMPEKSDPFTWIEKGVMAASWWPDPDVVRIYKKEGIQVVINCSEFENKKEIEKNFSYYHLNVPDYGLPSKEQIERFIEITDKYKKEKKAIVVHCVAGCGRTGQLIVAWGAYNKKIKDNMDPVKWIRIFRKCSLETKEQMNFARKIAREHLYLNSK